MQFTKRIRGIRWHFDSFALQNRLDIRGASYGNYVWGVKAKRIFTILFGSMWRNGISKLLLTAAIFRISCSHRSDSTGAHFSDDQTELCVFVWFVSNGNMFATSKASVINETEFTLRYDVGPPLRLPYIQCHQLAQLRWSIGKERKRIYLKSNI